MNIFGPQGAPKNVHKIMDTFLVVELIKQLLKQEIISVHSFSQLVFVMEM
jgi:hypothetical protein